MQQFSQKRSELTISIRRKQITERMQTLRSQYQLETHAEDEYVKYMPIVPLILNGTKPVDRCLKELKILSFWKEGATAVSKVIGALYSMLDPNWETSLAVKSTSNQAAEQRKQPQPSTLATQLYNQILTILLNTCIHIQLPIPSPIMQMIAISLMIPDRQIVSLWFISNVIYQRSQYSQQLGQELIYTCKILTWLQTRIEGKFAQEGDVVIFFYFCVGLLGVSLKPPHQSLQGKSQRKDEDRETQAKHKIIFGMVGRLLEVDGKAEENWWLLGQALPDYGWYIGEGSDYFFSTQIHNQYIKYCKQRKTKHIKAYLKMLINFCKSDPEAYTKLLKYSVFQTLAYCLENRFPEVKKLCAEMGAVLLNCKQGNMVDFENIPFFSNLGLELLNIQKWQPDIQAMFLTYAASYFGVLLAGSKHRNIPKNTSKKTDRTSSQLQDIIKSGLVEVIGRVVINGVQTYSVEIVKEGLTVLDVLLRADDKLSMTRILDQQSLPNRLQEIVQSPNPISTNKDLSAKICELLQYWEQSRGSEMI